MMKIALAALVAATLLIAACGDTETVTTERTVSSDPITVTEEVTTEATEEWPEWAQEAFLSGCGNGASCQCMLDELQSYISYEKIVANQGNMPDRLTYKAAAECVNA